jgi:phosphohistidine swiveling domain-containing protein
MLIKYDRIIFTMSVDYSKMTVEEIRKEVAGILKRQYRQDDLFRLAVFVGQLDLAKYIYHDRKHLPDARHGKSKAGETAAYGQALVQLLLLMESRDMDFGRVFEYAIEHMKDDEYKARTPERGDAVRGQPAGSGRVLGKAYVVSKKAPLEKAPEGSIIVMEHADAEMTANLGNVPAVVTDQGGRLCHLAIVAREMGKPVVVGTGNATELIKTGDTIVVDADQGVVTKGIQ